MPREDIYYSDKYNDDFYEYRHVIVPKKLAKSVFVVVVVVVVVDNLKHLLSPA